MNFNDFKYYVSKYDDLKHIKNIKMANAHYINFGIKEGRDYFNPKHLNENTEFKNYIIKYNSDNYLINYHIKENYINKKYITNKKNILWDANKSIGIPLWIKNNIKRDINSYDNRIKYIIENFNSESKSKFESESDSDSEYFLNVSLKVFLEYLISIDNITYLYDNKSKYHNLLKFNYDEYIIIYPHYKSLFKSKKLCFENYKKYSNEMKLIPNMFIYKIIELNQQYLQQLFLNEFKIEINIIKKNFESKFAIITRTHNRPELFKLLTDGLNSQYVSYKHIVSYDNIETKNYVEQYDNLILISITKHKDLHPNLYIDIMIKESGILEEDRWILIIDDDDIIYHGVLLYLSNLIQYEHFNSKDKLYIWKFYRNDKYIYPLDVLNPKIGEIATCNYMFHTSHYIYDKWENTDTGDYDFFINLYNTYKPENIVYIDKSLTGVNYKGYICGLSYK
jgi:hypothetical protein